MSVGETLAQARIERGLSVEDVSAATRVRATLIRAIENDDYALCGGAVYARGHIRSIAHVVGIDSVPLIAEFDRLHSDEQQQSLAVPAQSTFDPEIAARAERKGPNWTAAMAVALIAICVLAGVSLVGNHKKANQTTAQNQPGPVASATTTSPPPARPTKKASPPPSAVAQLPQDAIALVRVTGDKTWLQVTTDSGRVLFEGLLSTGQSKVFRDPKGLSMVIGNAPAVQLVADGRDYGSPKSQGSVARIRVAAGGAVQFA